MTLTTVFRGRRCAALVTVPLLVLAVGCQGSDGGDGGGGGDGKGDQVASVPEEGGKSGGDSGSSKGSGDSTGKSAFYDAQMDYVRCMRGKGGAPGFPAPKLSGHLDFSKIEELPAIGNGEQFKGGKDGACVEEMRRAMDLEPKRDKQQDYESMLAHAKCMRDHGVSKFRNPTMTGDGPMPGGDVGYPAPEIDTATATYKQARQACADKLLDGLDGMQ
ncbi:hypothetical protein [Streptomyces sp. G45]|uniref:hypothetical protein n=1 Tax=Streptomyces sp. G45 TaxID=3406627 RepID=UPI003C1FED4B